MNWEAVFFDFDGVILDSVHVKTEAFAKMFRKYGADIENKVVEYHLKNGGISRFEKFRYYYENLLNKDITDKELKQLGEVFTKHILKGVLESPFINGVMDTLKQLRNNNIPAYIVSGTPDEELDYIVEKKNLSSFFNEIHGSPRQKSEIIDHILKENNYKSDNCLFIGDAMSDYKAASETSVCFLGIVKDCEKTPFPEETIISHSVNCSIVDIENITYNNLSNL